MEHLSGDIQQHSRSSFNIHSSANRLKPEVLYTREIIYLIAREFFYNFSLLTKERTEFSTISLAV